MNVVDRRIGDKVVAVSYEDGYKDYAIKKLDEEQAFYESQKKLVEDGLDVIIADMELLQIKTEDIKQSKCGRCGMQTLKERRGRMRVFGGLFWTDSKPSPYKHCTNCGHDQELNPYRHPHLESITLQAERRLERAKEVVAKYTQRKEVI